MDDHKAAVSLLNTPFRGPELFKLMVMSLPGKFTKGPVSKFMKEIGSESNGDKGKGERPADAAFF